MKAHSLARVDVERDMHMRAWLDRSINATKKQGNNEVYVYKDFKQFFDYDKEISKRSGPKIKKLNEQHKRMARMAAELNSVK